MQEATDGIARASLKEGLEEATPPPRDSVNGADLAPLALAVTSVCTLFWSLSALLWTPSASTFASTVAARIVFLACLAGVFGYIAAKKTVIDKKTLFVGSWTVFAVPIAIWIQSYLTLPSALSCALYGIAGSGQACLVLLWYDCLTRCLANAQTPRVLSASALIAVLATALCMAFFNDGSMILLLFMMALSSVLFVYYLFSWYRKDSNKTYEHENVTGFDPTPSVAGSIGSQTLVYGAFLAIFFYECSGFEPVIVAGAAIGAGLVLLLEALDVKIILAPSLGQRIISCGLLISLATCSMSADLLLLDGGRIIALTLLAGTASFFALTSLSLILMEARELDFSTTVHASIGRMPVWLGVLGGLVVVSIVIVLGLAPDNISSILADVTIFVVAISTALHRSADPQYEKEEEAVPAQAAETVSDPVNPEEYVSPFRRYAEEFATDRGLTPREREVYHLLLRGRSTRFIQETLYISASTAKTHIASIYRKTDVSSKQELIDVVNKGSEQYASKAVGQNRPSQALHL